MNQVTPIDEEYIFDGSALISQTDLEGIIVYANKKFSEVSNYTNDELIGKQHNITRHPDMPRIVFEKMWNALSSGHTWNGLLKNLRKDGLYYWVHIEILPIFDENNEITGYISARRAASRKDIDEAKITYKKMLEEQK
jgi:aerotaxis receptor